MGALIIGYIFIYKYVSIYILFKYYIYIYLYIVYINKYIIIYIYNPYILIYRFGHVGGLVTEYNDNHSSFFQHANVRCC